MGYRNYIKIIMKKLLLTLVGSVATILGFAQTPLQTTVDHPEWSRNAVIYEVNLRQFTDEGTLDAFANHLPRLRDLGVDILWFMPIHPISEDGRKGGLGSYYAVRDYKAVNPEFGTLEDFKDVVNAAHALGMKVIIDWVPNHSGRDNAWVSEHPDWYARDEHGNMFGPFDWTDVYKFDYSNRELRDTITDAMIFWLKEADIDGFRCDVAGQVPVDYWNEARPKLEAAKKSVFMLAEAVEPELAEHCFDMVYNWPMKDLFSAIAATSGQYTFVGSDGNIRTFPKAHAIDIFTRLDEEARLYPADTYQMNMITNHDLNSWEGTEFERLGNLQAAFAVLTYTLPGMPLIYTGQEVGLNRAFEFFIKDNPPAWNKNAEFVNFYKLLNKLRRERPELASGVKGAPVVKIPTASEDVIAFRRGDVVTIANLGATEQKLFDVVPVIDGMTELFTGSTTLPETLPAGGYLVFVK